VTTSHAVQRRWPGVPLGLAYQEVLSAAVLAAMVAAGAMLAFDAASAPSSQLIFAQGGRGMPSWLAGPFQGLGEPLTFGRYYAELLALCGLWIAACVLAPAIRTGWAVTAIVVLHVLFALAPPIGLSDVFNYIGYARLLVEHGLNPYTSTLTEVPTDPVFVYATWPQWSNPYGPLSTLSFLPLGLTGVPQALWLVKAAAAAAGLGLVGLTAAAARALDRPVAPAVVFVGLNPTLLVYGVGGAHIDLLLVAASVAGIWLLARGRAVGAGVALATAAAIKVTGALPLVFALAGSRRRRDLALGVALAAVVVGGVALALFGPDLLSGVAGQREAASVRSVPGRLSRLLGYQTVPSALSGAFLAGFAVSVLALLRAAWRGMDWLEAAGWATLALLLALTWLMPWYVVWLLPLAALTPRPALRYAAVAITVYVVAVRLIPLN
jgi:hypothetical protein